MMLYHAQIITHREAETRPSGRVLGTSNSAPSLTVGPQRLSRIPEHGKEVTRRAGQDEQMPDEMVVAQAMCAIERHAGRVGNATGEQPKNAGERYSQQDRLCGDHD